MANVVEIVVRTTDATGPGRASVIAGSRAEARAVAAAAKEEEAARGRLLEVGKRVALGTTVAAIAIAAVSTKMAANWQAQMVRLSTSAGETGGLINNHLTGNLALVSAGLLKMARDTGTSTDELAKGMYMVESAGYHGGAGLKIMQAAAEGAKAEGAPLQEMGNALTSMMNAYHMGANKAVAATNQMVATVAAGKLKMADLATSISTVLPIAAAAGVSFGQVGGALATLTSQGVSAAHGTQMLAFTIRGMIAPNKVAQTEMKALGLSATDLATHIGQRGLSGTLEVVYTALKKKVGSDGLIHEMVKGKPVVETMDSALKKVMGGAVGLNTALLLGGTHAKTFSANVASVSAAAQGAGAHVKGWDEIQGTFNQRLSQVVESVKVMAIQIGTVLIPIVTEIMAKIVSFSGFLLAHTTLLKILGVVIGVVVVAAFTAWAISAGAAAAATIAATWPILAIIAVVALLAAGFMYLYNHCETFRKGVQIAVRDAKIAFDWLLRVAGDVIFWIRDHWSTISTILMLPIRIAVAYITTEWHIMLTVVQAVIKAVIFIFVQLPNNIRSAIGSVGSTLRDKGSDLINGMLNGAKDALSKLGQWASDIKDAVVGKIKSVFGINSPSTVFAALGGHMIDGLLHGLSKANPMAFIDKIFGNVENALGGMVGKGWVALENLPGKAWDALGRVSGKLSGWLSGIFGGGGGGHGSGVDRWRSVAMAALAYTHSPSSWIGSLLSRMQRESGGNPMAINLNDINAQHGDPSRGLMQTIMGTFLRYAGPLAGRGIYDPFANIVASINYANSAYGAAPIGWNRAGGYDRGGWLMPGRTLATNLTGRPEPVGWSFMQGLAGGGATQLEVVPGGGGQFEAFLAEMIRRYVRVRGGNVQNVLGS